MSIKEIESAIAALSPADLASLADWFEEFCSEQWDRQIEEDIKSGRLDALTQEAKNDSIRKVQASFKHSTTPRFWKHYGQYGRIKLQGSWFRRTRRRRLVLDWHARRVFFLLIRFRNNNSQVRTN